MALDLVATGYWILSSMVIYFSITTRVQVVITRPKDFYIDAGENT